MDSVKTPPFIADVIEKIGFGWAQVQAIFLGCSVNFADGCELLVISSVTRAVAADWGFTQIQKSFVVTLVFVGIFLGNFLSGPLGDKYGRRTIIVSAYFSIFAFNVASSYSWNFATLAITRLAAGLSFGLGQPVWNALGAEITPTKWRAIITCCGTTMFTLGEVYVAFLMVLDDPTLKSIDWRVLVRYASMPACFLAAGSMLFLIESPRWLAMQNRHEAAEQVLQSMAAKNGVADVNVKYKLQDSTLEGGGHEENAELDVRKKLRTVFGPKYLWSTLVAINGTFMANLIFYGGLYAFAQVLPNTDTGVSPAMEILLGACWEIPGIVLAVVVCFSLPRIPVMVFVSFFMAVCMTTFGIGLILESALLLDIGFYGCKVAGIPSFVVYYAYSTEIYPTKARTTGTAVILAGGRFAGMISPILYEGIVAKFSASSYFFYCSALAVINAFLAMTLPFETASAKLLDDDDDEVDEVAKPTVQDKAKSYGSVVRVM